MSATLKEMLETQQQLANSVFAQSAATNKLTNAIERLVAPFEQLRRDIYDIKQDRETDNAKVDLAIGRLSTDLALLLDNVKIAQGDVKTLARDVTASHMLPPPDHRTSAERLIDRFERLSTSTKVLVLLLAIVLMASGWLAHIIGG